MEKLCIAMLNDYQQRALETAIYPSEYKTVYPALGLTGEAGEVADKVKKVLRDTELKRNEDGSIEIPAERREQIAMELGDVCWYIATLAWDLGYTLQEIAEMNYAKLKSRQERGMIGGSGDNR